MYKIIYRDNYIDKKSSHIHSDECQDKKILNEKFLEKFKEVKDVIIFNINLLNSLNYEQKSYFIKLLQKINILELSERIELNIGEELFLIIDDFFVNFDFPNGNIKLEIIEY